MATAAVIARPDTGLVPASAPNPGVVLMDREAFNAWYDSLRAKAPSEVDVTTKRGRDELRSFAATVRSEKAAIDKARLRLTQEWRDMTAQANAAGKEIAEKLESLAVEVRAPLTAWEEIEEARVAECQRVVAYLREAAVVAYEETSVAVRERLTQVAALKLDPVQLDGYMPQAAALRDTAVAALTAAAERMEKEEAERAELERLRAAEAERQARETAEREERERADRERAEAEAAEQRRKDAEEAEAARIREAAERAAEEARAEEARKAREAEEERQREHDAALAEAQRAREEAERVAREEREAREREDAARAAETRRAAEEKERQAEEDRKREANRAHRTRVQRAAKEAIMTCGADEDTARKIVLAIIAGEIPAVSLAF